MTVMDCLAQTEKLALTLLMMVWAVRQSICLDAVSQYCHPPNTAVLGLEGFGHENDDLMSVHVIINNAETNLIDTFSSSTRSGSRNCLSQSTGSRRRCKMSDITKNGITQQRNLGQYIFDIYTKRMTRPKASFLAYRSISSLDSQSAFIHGFQHSEKLVNMKHSAWKDDFTTRAACKQLGHDFFRNILNVDLFLNKTQYQHGTNRSEIYHFLNRVPFMICNKQDSDIKNNLSNLRKMKEIFQHIDANHAKLIENETIDAYNYCMNSFIYYLIHKLEKSNSSESVNIYHVDNFIFSSVLVALTRKATGLPRPSSRLVFEVYNDTSTFVSSRRLRVLFNGQDITQEVPLCNRKSWNETCPLKYFSDFQMLNLHKRRHNH